MQRWPNSPAELMEQAVAVRGEDLLEGTGGGDASGFEEDHFGGDAPDFGEVVGDVEDARGEGEQAGEDVLRAGVVEGAERLIEEKQIRSGRECASERDALALSAGELRGATRGEMISPKEMEHFDDAAVADFRGEMADAEGDVVACGEVREERGLLRDESDGAAAGRDGDALVGFEKSAAGEGDAALMRCGQPSEDAEDGAFAGAGRSEEDGPAGGEREIRFEGEMALTVADLHVRHERSLPLPWRWGGVRKAG